MDHSQMPLSAGDRRTGLLAEAREWLRKRQTGTAIRAFSTILLEAPDYAAAWVGLAQAAETTQRPIQVARAARRARTLTPDDDGARALLIRTSIDDHGPSGACMGARTLAILEPQSPWCYWKLGRAARDLGRLDVALPAARRLVALRPDSQQSFWELGQILHAYGDYAARDRLFQAAEARFSNFNRSFLGLQTMNGTADPVELLMPSPSEHERAHIERSRLRIYPRAVGDFRDYVRLVTRSLFDPAEPSARPFAAEARLLTMGSCFAAHLRAHLAAEGKAAGAINMPENLNNTFALRQFIEWVTTGDRSSDAYWYDNSAEGGLTRWNPTEERAHYADVFRRTDGFVLTLGLSEVWRDRASGGVFWRGVPKRLFDPERHECVQTTVAENRDNLARIVELVRAHCGARPIVLTLSPVPLQGTVVGRSCVESDCVSKSTLRVAIDELMREKPEDVHYWPSFEAVRWLAAHCDRATFGSDGDPHHVSADVVSIIIRSFVERFFETRPAAH